MTNSLLSDRNTYSDQGGNISGVDSGKQRRYATKILPGLSAVELNVSEHNVVFVLLRIAASCGEFGEMTGFIPPETV